MECRLVILSFFFFKQKTAYEMRISDWSSDVCSSDLRIGEPRAAMRRDERVAQQAGDGHRADTAGHRGNRVGDRGDAVIVDVADPPAFRFALGGRQAVDTDADPYRSATRRVGKACVGTGRSRL